MLLINVLGTNLLLLLHVEVVRFGFEMIQDGSLADVIADVIRSPGIRKTGIAGITTIEGEAAKRQTMLTNNITN
jgi:hypothetical protein